MLVVDAGRDDVLAWEVLLDPCSRQLVVVPFARSDYGETVAEGAQGSYRPLGIPHRRRARVVRRGVELQGFMETLPRCAPVRVLRWRTMRTRRVTTETPAFHQ